MKKINKNLTLFILILAFGIFLRLVLINKVPPSLNWDEVSHGYNAYSILTTGKDEWGASFPTIFRAYGDYKLPGYIYLTSISESIFGLSAFSVRLVSIVSGIVIIVFGYLIAKKLFNERAALLAALFLAIEPWSFFLSRGAFEANLSVAFIVMATHFFLEGIKKADKLLLSSVFFGLSVWSYNSARIFTPIFVLSLGLIFNKDLKKLWKKHTKKLLLCLGILLVFVVPMILQLVTPTGQARYGWVAIIDEGAVARINEARNTSALPETINLAVNNKPVYFAKTFLLNYFSHFSPEFLYFKGGSQFQFNLPDHGLLYIIGLPFFLIGLLRLVMGKNKKDKILLLWFLLSPIASSLTREAPHTLRAIIMFPALILITAYGLASFSDWMGKKKIPQWVVFGFYFFFMFIFAEDYYSGYFNDYPVNYSWSWQYGYSQIVDYAKANYEEHDKIIVTKKYGEPHEFFLFYGGVVNPAPWPWDPKEYREDKNLVRFFQSNWYWVDMFDKFYFVNDWDIPERSDEQFKLESGEEFSCKDESCLLITSKENYPAGWEKVGEIKFLDESTAFEIYEN